MDITALQSKVNASSVPIEDLAGNPNLSQDAKVGEVSRQFEAVLLRQILTEARKPMLSGEKESSITGIYGDMINNQMADSISRSGTFGLAKSLQTQLAHQVLPNSGDAQSQTAPPNTGLTKSKNH